MTTSSEARWTAVGGVVDQTRATLSLIGEDLDPAAITEAMGVDPSASYRKGDRISVAREDTRQAGLWALQVDVTAPEDAETAVARLLAMLPAGTEFWANLQGRYRIELNLTVVVKAWNRGFVMPAPVVEELARRGLSLTVEVYAEPQAMPSACFA